MTLTRDRKIHLIQVLFLTLIIIIIAISLRPIIRETDRKMNQVKSELIDSLEKVLGYEIDYTSISPSIFSFINIKDLVVYKDKENKIILAQIKSFKAYYSPFYFITKNAAINPLQAVRMFKISNAKFNIDQNRDADLLQLFTQQSDISLLPLKTAISGKKISINIKTSQGIINANDLFLSFTPESDFYKTKMDGTVNVELSNSSLNLKEVNSRLVIKGTIAEYFDSFNFTVTTKDLKSNILDLQDQTFQLISSPEEVLIRKVQDNTPFDLALRYNKDINDIVISFNAENFVPNSMISLKDSLQYYTPYASSKITGEGTLLLNSITGAVLYSLDSDIMVNKDIFGRDIFINTEITGDNKRINVKNLDIKTFAGRIFFNGNILTDTFFPEGTIHLRDIKTPLNQNINSELVIERDSGFLFLDSKYLSLGNNELGKLDLVLFPGDKSITGSLKVEIVDDKGIKGDIVADAVLDYRNKPQLTSFVNINQFPVKQTLSLLPNTNSSSILDSIKDLKIDSNINITSDFNKIDAQVKDFKLYSNQNRENYINLTGFYTDSSFAVNDLLVNWNGYNLNGYITSMKEDGDYIISTHFDLQEKPYRFEAVYKKNKNLIFNGDYGIAGYIQNNKKENIRTFQLISDSIPIPLNEGLLYTELNINGFIKDSEWKVFLNQTKIYSEDIFTLKSPELLVSAELNKDGCDFNNIYYKDKTSALKGSGRLLYKNGIIDSWASIKDESNISNEKYDLFFSKTGENIESRISINSAHLARFTKSGLTGMISANAVFSGSLTEPDLRADIETDQVTFNRIPIKIKSNIKTDKDIIRLSDLELNYNGLMIKRGLVLCELNKGKLLATAGIEQNINGSNVETAVTALLSADNTFNISSINKLASSQIDGKVTVAPITWDEEIKTFPQLNISIRKDGNILSAIIDKGKVLDGEYNLGNGDLHLEVKELFPVQFVADGNIKESEVNIDINSFYFDPEFINYFMPTDPYKNKRHVVFNDGSVTGNLSVTGKISDPDLNGRLFLNDLEVESPYLSEVPEPASTVAYFEGHSIKLDPLIIKLKNGEIDARSSFEFDGRLPTTYNVDVYITGTPGARVSYKIPHFSWDGHFTGVTHIEGSSSGGFLKSELICNDLVSSLKSDAVAKPGNNQEISKSVNGFTVDLTVQTGKDVNFYFPNQQLPIIQATAERGDILKIEYDSQSDVFALTGKINIRNGEINYFNKTFYLQEGFIDFNESQSDFNPRLNVRADINSKDEIGEDVTISLLVDDYLLNEFNPTFLSFPGKSENEIRTLLGQSFTPSSDSENINVASILLATGGMMGKNAIMQPFEEAIKSSFQLDFVSLNTNIIENAILDRFQNQDFSNFGNQEMNFVKYLENTNLFIGKYIGEFLYLEGSLVLDYDEIKGGTSSILGGLEPILNLNLKFITPFVLIDWTYNPKSSEYFFSQNTISFSWQYTF